MRAGVLLEPASPEARFHYPQPSRGPLWVWLVALALHLPLVFVPVSRAIDADPGRPLLIRLAPPAEVGRVVAMPFGRSPTQPAANGTAVPMVRVRPATPTPAGMQATPFVAPRADTATGAPAPPSRTGTVTETPPLAAGGPRRIAPSYASGRLWVRPLPVSPQELAARVRERSHIEKVDSAVEAIIQDYLDRLALEEASQPEPLPSWTTKIAGKTVGVDSKWIYLGPIRVPAFLLGLIPLNVQANPTQAEMNRRLNVMREDIFNAARRSANYADFKAAVTRLREETQRERDFQEAQRNARPEQGDPP